MPMNNRPLVAREESKENYVRHQHSVNRHLRFHYEFRRRTAHHFASFSEHAVREPHLSNSIYAGRGGYHFLAGHRGMRPKRLSPLRYYRSGDDYVFGRDRPSADRHY